MSFNNLIYSPSLIDVDGKTGGSRLIDKYPDKCPYCYHTIKATLYQGFIIEKDIIELVFRCPNLNCLRISIAYYKHIEKPTVYAFYYQRSSQGTIQQVNFSKNICNISPDFVQIYNEALAAENHGLSKIIGISLRKALEFLIKDYLVFTKPEDQEQILKKMLGPCIKDYIEDPKIKNMAERAVWLGNDHTHYVKKWEDKDLKDLKILIELTIHWIEMEMLTARYETEM